jgi:predicted Rossmann fold nucleotide-binding protein DprA/Smf involved in DNA uptake
MTRRSDNSLATLLLVSRIVPSESSPLSARDFWKVVDRVAEPGQLLGRDRAALTSEFGDGLGARIPALLNRATALAFAVEELEHKGISTVSVFDDEYPPRWKSRLGTAAPGAFHAAGPVALLARGGIAIVGSREVAPAAADVAKQVAQQAAEAGHVVISGGARGTDRLAMHAALDAGGAVVGVLADALVRTVNDTEIRRGIADERLCLVTPYAPTAPFSAENAMARNKLVYALADVTFVVASDHETGGTWAGATEALKKHYGTVLVWTGPGAGPGNEPLIGLGATPVHEIDQALRAFDLPEHPRVTDTSQTHLGI